MSKLVKRLLLAFFAIIALIVVTLVTAYFLIDANSFKQKIITEVHDATGRELTIDGELDISLFPWLGLRANNISLSNAAGFSDQPFASIERVEFGIKLAPVFRKEIEADTITLHGLKLYLGINEQGISNWADLLGEQTKKETPQSSNSAALTGLAAFSIGGIDVRDADIVWHDQQASQQWFIRNFNFNSGAILPGKPISLKMAFDIDSQPTLINGHIKLSGIASIDLTNQLLAIGNLKLISLLDGPALPTQTMEAKLSSDLSLDMANDSLSMQNLAFNVLGLSASGQLNAHQLSNKPSFRGQLDVSEFSLRDLLAKLGMAVDTVDPTALTKTSLNIDFEGNTTRLALTSLGAIIDDTQLSGNVSIAEFNKPSITAKLKLDKIDLDRYLPPTAEENKFTPVGTVSSDTTANVTDTTTKAPIDNSWMHPLRTMIAKVQFDVDSLKINNLTLTQLATTLTAKGGLLTLHPLTASLYNGSYQGNIQLNANLDTPIISVNETLKDVAAGPLLKDLTGDDKILGTVSSNAKLTMRGTTPDQIKKTANGDIRFAFIHGAIKGVNIAKVVRDAKAKLSGQPVGKNDEPAQTDFAELSGTINIKSGLLQNHDLLMKSPFFRIVGRGKVDLLNESIDYLTEVNIVETSKGQGGKDLAQLRGLTIPVKISGTFTEPKFTPDLTSMIGDQTKQKAKEKIDKKKNQLKGKLLEKLGVKQDNAVNDSSEATNATQESPQEKLEDKLKSKLKGLF